VKCRIHFDGRELTCVESKPMRFWQIKWIEDAAPVVKAPCARADAYFLLVEQIQMELKRYSVLVSKRCHIGRRDCAKNLTGRIS